MILFHYFFLSFFLVLQLILFKFELYGFFLLKIISLLIPLIIAIAFLTLLERKVIASMQQRRGPNVVGFLGLLQPLADGLKLVLKETALPSSANHFIFFISPILLFGCSLLYWFIVPLGYWTSILSMEYDILYIFVLSSLSVYGIIFAGWSSNSKYALLGGLRSTAQMISYEVSLGILLLNVVLFTQSFQIRDIVEQQYNIWYFIPLFPVFILFFISALAETNRTPFDLPEAEGELVAGYNVEYSALTFALFFLGEYANMIFMSILIVILFFGGWSTSIFSWNIQDIDWLEYISANFQVSTFYFVDLTEVYSLFGFQSPYDFCNFFYLLIFSIKTLIILIFFIWVRAAYPRYRYNTLMTLGWKIILPLSLSILIINICIYIYFVVLY